MTIASLQLSHTQLAASLVAGGVKYERVPPLRAFLPDDEREADTPRDFNYWARSLLQLVPREG